MSASEIILSNARASCVSAEVTADRSTPLPPPPLKRFLDYLFVECGLAGNTVTAYQRDLGDFWNHLVVGGVNLRELRMDEVQRHMMALQKRGLAMSSIARKLSAIKMFLRFAFAHGEMERDLATLLESPRRWTRLPKSMHLGQVEALLQAPKPEEEFYLRDRAMLELLYATGMRVSEMTQLTLDQMNLDIGYLRCFGKGSKERIIPIGRPALSAVKAYLESQRPQLVKSASQRAVFLSRTGRPIDRTNVWRLVRKYADRCGVGACVSPHTLRHCFATHLLAGGADLRILQELLGHADVSTTQIYTHVDESHLKNVHRRFHPRP